jgi:hypothetical protein
VQVAGYGDEVVDVRLLQRADYLLALVLIAVPLVQVDVYVLRAGSWRHPVVLVVVVEHLELHEYLPKTQEAEDLGISSRTARTILQRRSSE